MIPFWLACIWDRVADLDRIGWSHNIYNEELFRVFEYGAM